MAYAKGYYVNLRVNKMYEIIVNPGARSARGVKIWNKVEHLFRDANVQYNVHFTERFNEGGDIISDICKEYSDKGEPLHFIIFGGDGTVNGILQKIPSLKDVIISVIPIGSSNDFARDVGISTKPEEAVKHLLTNPTSMFVDIGYVHQENKLVRSGEMDIPDRRFLVSTGIGYDAAICEEAMSSGIKNFFNKIGLGKLTYLGVALKQLMNAEYITGELTLNNGENIIPLERLLFLAGMNHKYEGGGFMFGPEANNHDGMLELCAVTKISKPKILFSLPKAYKGRHFGVGGIEHYRARSYTVRVSKPLFVHADGEVDAKADFISVFVDEEALQIVY